MPNLKYEDRQRNQFCSTHSDFVVLLCLQAMISPIKGRFVKAKKSPAMRGFYSFQLRRLELVCSLEAKYRALSLVTGE
jgi:hypothetical protein